MYLENVVYKDYAFVLNIYSVGPDPDFPYERIYNLLNSHTGMTAHRRYLFLHSYLRETHEILRVKRY